MNRLTRNLGPLLIVALATGAMLAWTWHRCPDPVVDFGRELYVPWRITEGQVLYRDLNYFNGPFSPYFNAAVFELFGTSLRTLKIANAAIIVGVALLLHQLVWRMSSSRIAAMTAGVTFAVVFGCGQLNENANFNFLTPYSHDLTHGVALSLLMVVSLARASTATRRSTTWLALAGLLLGTVALTKAEVLLAAVGAAVVGVAAMLWIDRPAPRWVLAQIGLFVLCVLVAPLLAFALLAQAMPTSQALAGVTGTWQWAGDPRLLRISYFRWTMGIDQPLANVKLMLYYAVLLGAIIAVPTLLALVVGRRFRGRGASVIAFALAVMTLVTLMLATDRIRWSQISRPLPLYMLALGIVLVWQVARRRVRAGDLALPLIFTALAGLLLAKMILRASVWHYGFALGMPAAIVLLAGWIGWIPNWIARASASSAAAWIARAPALSACAVYLVVVLGASAKWMAVRTFWVGDGADAFLADERGAVMNEAVNRVRALTSPDDTLTVIPEGNMLNYLARRVNPTRYQNFLPAEVMLFDEQKMLAELMDRPPDWIALVHADTRVYDAQYFGQHYARDIARWLEDNYVPATPIIGAYPFLSDQFGILLLKRKHVPRDTGF
jgi:hypothetical protein